MARAMPLRDVLAGSAMTAVALFLAGCSTVPTESHPLPPYVPQPTQPPVGSTEVPLEIFVKVVGGPEPSDGGSASVQRTELDRENRCGVTACVVVPEYREGAGYVGQLSLTPGAYVVTYAPPSGYRVADGVVNPQSVTVTSPGPPRMVLTFTLTP